MKSVLYLVIAPMIMVTVAASASPSMFQSPHAMSQEPGVFNRLFHVDPVSGVPIALETLFPKTKKIGPVQTHGFKADTQAIQYYFDGAKSPAAFSSAEPHVFVIGMKPLATSQEQLLQEMQQAVISPLVVKDGKRFFTDTTLPLEVRTVGQARPIVDNKKKERVEVFYQLTSRTALPPRGYVLFVCSRPCDFTYGFLGGTFEIGEAGRTSGQALLTGPLLSNGR